MTTTATVDRAAARLAGPVGGTGTRPRARSVGRSRTWRLVRWVAEVGCAVRGRVAAWSDAFRGRSRLAGDAGMATAEYAIATIAAAGFAGLLVVVLRSDEVRGLLAGLVRTALSM